MVHNGTERISCRTRDDAGVSTLAGAGTREGGQKETGEPRFLSNAGGGEIKRGKENFS